MARRKHRPTDPAEAARKAYETRRNPALWGVNEEARQLPSNADITSTEETRTKTRRVERFDCFSTLKLSDHQFTAIRRYQADLAESYGVGDRLNGPGGGQGSRELVTGRLLAASDRCDALLELLSDGDCSLLNKLSLPSFVYGKEANWKAIVAKHTGHIDRDCLAKAVKDLSESVRLAYAEIDGQGQRRAA